MPNLFAKPPAPPALPKMAPPTQTPLTQELTLMNKQRGMNAAATSPAAGKRGSALTHTLTG